MENYEETKNTTYEQYKKIKTVYCPYLKTDVVFNSNGFRHMIYTAKSHKRDEPSQIMRFELLSKACGVLSLTTTLQEYQSETKEVFVKEHGKKVAKIVTVTYFGFIAIAGSYKIKVIIKRVGQGHPFFWSVIPNWKTRQKERLFFKGNLEED